VGKAARIRRERAAKAQAAPAADEQLLSVFDIAEPTDLKSNRSARLRGGGCRLTARFSEVFGFAEE
jgi:hypothetical protein